MSPPMTNAEWDAKWAERDARRDRHEAYMNAQAEAERNRLVGVVEAALTEWSAPCASFATVADFAIAALEADGVVFARLGSWEDDDDVTD